MIRVLIWNEFHHERTRDNVRAIYPEGIHGCIRDFLKVNDDLEITTATLSEENIGQSDELLKNTDVLLWWGHVKHKDVPDEWVAKIVRRVQEGMGFIGLHSAHHSVGETAAVGELLFTAPEGIAAGFQIGVRDEQGRAVVGQGEFRRGPAFFILQGEGAAAL